MSWSVLGKVWLFAILPGYLSNDTQLHTAPAGHFSHWQEFGCKDVPWMLIFLWPSESYLGGSEGFPRRAGCINFPSNMGTWSSETDGFAAKNWTLYTCISVKSGVSRAKTKHKRARLCWLQQVHSLRAYGKETEMHWPLGGKPHGGLKDGMYCITQTLKSSEVWGSSWTTLSSVLCLGTECPGCPVFHAGPAHGHETLLCPRPCLSLAGPRKDRPQKGERGEEALAAAGQ